MAAFAQEAKRRQDHRTGGASVCPETRRGPVFFWPMRDRIPLLAGLGLLALAVLVGAIFVGHGIRDRNRNDVITVTGSAKKRISSDYVVWRSSLTSEAGAAPEAETTLARWTARARKFFSEQGITAAELTVKPVSAIVPGSIDENGETVSDYRLTRSFEVRSSRVGAITAIAERTSKLLHRGVPLASTDPEYVYTKLSSLRPQLLTAAIHDAQHRAKVIVSASGTHLGKIRDVDVGVFQITAPNSTEVSDYGEYDTSTLAKDVTAVVNVTYALH